VETDSGSHIIKRTNWLLHGVIILLERTTVFIDDSRIIALVQLKICWYIDTDILLFLFSSKFGGSCFFVWYLVLTKELKTGISMLVILKDIHGVCTL
jgi:hypothetical protein